MEKTLEFQLKINGKIQEKEYSIEIGEGQSYIIQKNDIFSFDDISMFHCTLYLRGNTVFVKDMGSEAGTYVNGLLVGIRPKGLTDHEIYQHINDYISFPFRVSLGDSIQLGEHVELILKNIFDKEKKNEIVEGYSYLRTLHSHDLNQICLVEENETKKQYILKIWNPGIVKEEVFPYFKKDLMIQQSLNHPYFAKVYKIEWDKKQRTPYMIMEYYEHSIKGIFKDKEKNEENMKQLLLQFLEALDYLHHMGLAHHRIKLENVFLTYDDKGNPSIKIADVSLRSAYRYIDFDLIPEYPAKERYYFTPRQQFYVPKKEDISIDIWAVCAMVCYLITGKPVREFVY